MNDCGSYDIQGSTVRFRWPDGFGLMAESSGAYTAGTSLKNEDHDSSFVAPVSGDFKLNGRYSSFFASSGSYAFPSGSVSVEKFITFTPDGRYQKQGFSAASFSDSNAAGTVGGKRAPSQGTYEVHGYTMLPHPAGGPEETYAVILGHQEPHPKAVFIDDDGYLAK